MNVQIYIYMVGGKNYIYPSLSESDLKKSFHIQK